MLKRTYLLSGIAVLTALGLMACGSSGSGQTEAKGSVSGNSGTEAAANEESLNFTMALVDNSQSNYYKGAEKIAELVNEATEGKIQLTIQAGGVLGGEADTLDMAIQGDLDIATCANSVLANYIPEMSILDQAFLWDSADQANYAVQNELGDLISAEAEKHGLHVIGYLESGFRDVFSKKPIQTPADFKGVKIRVMQNEGQLAAFTAFGANPVAISASEQFTALQQGTIDACENAVSNCWINKYYEAGVNSITNTKHCFVYIPICMSDNAWNKIPEDMREPFVNAVQEGCKAQWTYLNEANAEAVENLEGAGVTFYDIDTEALKAEYQAAQEKNGAPTTRNGQQLWTQPRVRYSRNRGEDSYEIYEKSFCLRYIGRVCSHGRCFCGHGRFLFHFCAESEFYPGLHALDRRDSHIQYDLYGAAGNRGGSKRWHPGSGDCRGGQTTRCGPQDCGSYPAGDSGGICFYHD